MQTNCCKCGQPMECMVHDIENCACTKIVLSPATRDFLTKTYFSDCLCNKCLEALEDFVKYAGNFSLPQKNEPLEEGLHFYMEGSHFIFTELYHYLKGKCCNNGCRHCVYGFKTGLSK